MAGDWIKMRADLLTHPKVVRISSALKADKLRTIGGLMSVCCLFDAHSDDGHLEGYSQADIDDLLRWDGFAGAMISVGWLVDDGAEGLALPRFDTHNGQSAKRRAHDTERKRESRKMSASDADRNRTREEKRREEINTTEPNGSVRAGKPRPASVDPSELVAAGFTESEASEFIAHKQRMKAPLTPRAWNDHLRESAKAGWTPRAAAEKVMAKSWKGFEAKYVARDSPHLQPIETFAERDERLAAEKVARWTGGLANARIDKPLPFERGYDPNVINNEVPNAARISQG